MGVLWQKQRKPRIVWAGRTGCWLSAGERGNVWSPSEGTWGCCEALEGEEMGELKVVGSAGASEIDIHLP